MTSIPSDPSLRSSVSQLGSELRCALSTEMWKQLQQVEQELLAEYGLFMRHGQVAEVIGTSPASLRNTMRRSRDPIIEYLLQQKRRFGRRVRYLTFGVAKAMVFGPSEIEAVLQESDAGGIADE